MKTKHVTLQHPGAASVFIAGSFNEWSPDATPMLKVGEGSWVTEIALPPGRYEYRFVVDGEWMDEPQAVETVPNPFDGLNAVLSVE